MDRSVRIRAADGSLAGPAHPSRPHPGDERGKLSAQGQQTEAGQQGTSLGRPALILRRRFTRAAFAAAYTRPAGRAAVLRSRRPCKSFKPRPLPPEKWSTFSPPQWSSFAPPLTDEANQLSPFTKIQVYG